MANNQNASREGNFVPTALAVSSVDFQSTVTLAADPISHRLLVDLAGGVQTGALGFEIPAGTVNGVNTVFTVQNIPQFVEVSGQVMASSTQDPSNFGYVLTGTSAPYTITFSTAPTLYTYFHFNGTSPQNISLTTKTYVRRVNFVIDSGATCVLSNNFKIQSYNATSQNDTFTEI